MSRVFSWSKMDIIAVEYVVLFYEARMKWWGTAWILHESDDYLLFITLLKKCTFLTLSKVYTFDSVKKSKNFFIHIEREAWRKFLPSGIKFVKLVLEVGCFEFGMQDQSLKYVKCLLKELLFWHFAYFCFGKNRKDILLIE